MEFSTRRTFALFLGHTRKPSFCHQWLPRTWCSDRFGLAHGGQCKLTRDHPSALLSGDGAQISLTHISLANLSQNFVACSECYSSILCNLSDCQTSVSANNFSHTCHGLLVWEVDGLPGRGSSSKDRRPFLKREYHLNVFDWLRQDSPKAACNILVRFSTSFPKTETEIDAHTLLNFLLHREMRCTLWVDVHLQASTERMQGDNGFRFCTYTCTELPRVPHCCHLSTSYSYPEKKSVPELYDQPSYYCLEGYLLCRILVEKYWLYGATNCLTCYEFSGFCGGCCCFWSL